MNTCPCSASRLKEELLQSLWWEPVGRPGSRVGKATGKQGEEIRE